MLNRDIFEYKAGLEVVSKIKGSSKFSYAVAKNIRKLAEEVDAIRAGFDTVAQEDQASVQAYEVARVKLINEYSSKAGDPTVTDHLPFIEEQAKFFEELNKLKESNSKAADMLQVVNNKIDKVLKEEFAGKLDFYKVRAEDLPDGLSPNEVLAVDFMLE